MIKSFSCCLTSNPPTYLFITIFAYKQCLICAYFSPDSDRVTVSLERAMLYVLIMDMFLANMQLLISQDMNWWTGVVCITCGLLWCFISCLDSHSDGTHSLQRIHWWASYVMLNFNKTFPVKKHTHLHLGCPADESIFSAHLNFGGGLLLQFITFP